MKRVWILALAIAASLGVGCTSQQDAEPAGSVTVSLLGRTPSGSIYRLRDAFFEVQGPTFALLSSEFVDPDASSISEFVEPGPYQVILQPGWRLERLTPSGEAFTVEARLLTSNPQFAFVEPGGRTNVVFRFQTDAGVISMDDGLLTIGIDVIEGDSGSFFPVDSGPTTRFPDAGFPTTRFPDSGFPFPTRFPDSGTPTDSGAPTRFECLVGAEEFLPLSCPMGTACFADGNSTACETPGPGLEGEPCMVSSNCAAGFACDEELGFVCMPACNVAFSEFCGDGRLCFPRGGALELGGFCR